MRKSTESCDAAWTFPVAETDERTTPRVTGAERIDACAAGVDDEVTVKYAPTPRPTTPAARKAFTHRYREGRVRGAEGVRGTRPARPEKTLTHRGSQPKL